MNGDGQLECQWTDGDLKPQQLADILTEQDPAEELEKQFD